MWGLKTAESNVEVSQSSRILNDIQRERESARERASAHARIILELYKAPQNKTPPPPQNTLFRQARALPCCQTLNITVFIASIVPWLSKISNLILVCFLTKMQIKISKSTRIKQEYKLAKMALK